MQESTEQSAMAHRTRVYAIFALEQHLPYRLEAQDHLIEMFGVSVVIGFDGTYSSNDAPPTGITCT
jgi:hypothetical protein